MATLRERLARLPVIGTALMVQQRYRHDAADQLAAAIGFFGFLSLVPLLLLVVAGAGFVYSDPDDQARVALLLTDLLPGFEATVGVGDGGVAAMVATVVDRRGAIGVVGFVGLLVTGMKVVASAMAATRVVFRGEVLTGVGGRVRQLGAMVVLGALALAAVAASSLAAPELVGLPRAAALSLGLVVTFIVDLGLFLGAYTLLSPTSRLTTRQLLPGATLAAVGWTLLQVVGASFVGAQADRANLMYGALGGVVALLLLLYLAGRLYLYGAELSATLVERRDGPLGDGGVPPVESS